MRMAAERGFTMLVGLEVIDQDGYARYRAAMTPILERYGGRFGYDFVIAEVLRSEVAEPINRVFTLVFPDRATMAAFFEDPEYRGVRARHFESAVGHVTRIAEF
jgi:uncharacterized protein (DUF1330 family)